MTYSKRASDLVPKQKSCQFLATVTVTFVTHVACLLWDEAQIVDMYRGTNVGAWVPNDQKFM